MAEAEQEIGRPLPSHQVEGAVQFLPRLPEGPPVPPGEAAGERRGGLPFQVPEGQVLGPAEVQHPLREGALRPDPDLAPEVVDEPRQHGPTHSTEPIFPPIRSSPAVMASRVSRSPRTRRTPAVVLASICSSV